MNTIATPSTRPTGAIETTAAELIASVVQGVQRLGHLLRMPAPGVPEATAQLLRMAAAYETSQPSYAADLRAGAPAIERLVSVQQQFVGRTKELVSVGCPDRRLSTLGPALDSVFDHRDVLRWITVEPERAAALVAWVNDAVRTIDALGIPDTLVHGDFHPGNVALADGRAVIIDWSDAAVTDPALDLGLLLRDLGPRAFATVTTDRAGVEAGGADPGLTARAWFHARVRALEDLAHGLAARDAYLRNALRATTWLFAPDTDAAREEPRRS